MVSETLQNGYDIAVTYKTKIIRILPRIIIYHINKYIYIYMYAYITFEIDYDSFQAAHEGETKEISRE